MKSGDDKTNLTIQNKDCSMQKYRGIRIGSSTFSKCVFSGSEFESSAFIDTTFKDCNFTGANLARVYLKNVTFTDCKFDIASFMGAELKNVVFESCTLKETLFVEADVTKLLNFNSSTLEQVDFRAIRTKDGMIDLRTSTVNEPWGISSIRNVTVSPEQLIQIAPTLALEAGIKIADKD